MTLKELKNLFVEANPAEMKVLEPLMEQYIETLEHLKYLNTLPKLKVNPKNKMQQVPTQSGKDVIKYTAQLTSIANVLLRVARRDKLEEESSLAKLLKGFEMD